MASYGQADRIAEVKTKLGNKLFLTRFSGSEGMSQLFHFQLETVAEDDGNIDFNPQIGQNVTVILRTNGQGERFFTGTCVEALRMGRYMEGYQYLLVLRPALWLLSKRVNSRVFHNMRVPDILAEVFADHAGVIETEDKTKGSHPDLEYCVQHRESDLNFVLRLMENAGISYHFKFGDDSQKLVLCDSESAYEAAPGGKRDYYDTEEFHIRDNEHFYRWMAERRFTTNKAVLTDYKLQQPGDDNLGEHQGDAKFNPKLEDYRHPFPQHLGKNTSPSEGKTYAETRVLSERDTDGHYLADGDCGSLVPGTKVTLAKHPSDDGDYVVLGCRHNIEVQLYRSVGGGSRDGDQPYRGEFELMKLARFIPPIVTPKPIVGGPQTGVVVGDNTDGSDNEIHTDEFGRIKVHMHWNREPKGKEKGQTMWCRLSSQWAGQRPRWGAIFIPRVGTEVLVDYLDGDPDRPIVTGSVYHQDNMQPYDLPGDEFMAGWKSNFEGGDGYNEIVMIDKSGEEKIRVHTTKDLLTEVERDETRQVDNERKTTIGVNDTHDVGQELKVTAGVLISLTVGPSSIKIEPQGITIKAPMITVEATGMLTTKAGGMAEHTAGGIMTIKGAVVNIN